MFTTLSLQVSYIVFTTTTAQLCVVQSKNWVRQLSLLRFPFYRFHMNKKEPRRVPCSAVTCIMCFSYLWLLGLWPRELMCLLALAYFFQNNKPLNPHRNTIIKHLICCKSMWLFILLDSILTHLGHTIDCKECIQFSYDRYKPCFQCHLKLLKDKGRKVSS